MISHNKSYCDWCSSLIEKEDDIYFFVNDIFCCSKKCMGNYFQKIPKLKFKSKMTSEKENWIEELYKQKEEKPSWALQVWECDGLRYAELDDVFGMVSIQTVLEDSKKFNIDWVYFN